MVKGKFAKLRLINIYNETGSIPVLSLLKIKIL